MRLYHLRPSGRRLRIGAIALLLSSALAVTAACSAGNGRAGDNGKKSGSGGQTTKMGKPYQFGICCSWGTSWVYNKYTSYYPGFADGFVYQPLAVQQPPKLTDYKPALADKWTKSGNQIKVHIRDGQKWQNGKPVTSDDLIATMLLDATQGSAVMNDITDAKKVDKSTISVTVRKSTPSDLALVDLLDLRPLPKSQFGRFLSSGLKKQIFSYYNEYAKHPDKADKSTAKRAMDATFKKVSKYKPKDMIGNGPFKLQNMNTQKANLEKSKTYVNAAKVRIPKLVYVNGQENQVLYNLLTSKQLDFSNVGMPGPIAEKITHMPDYHVATPPGFEFAMYFNSRSGPTSNTSVRKALAYVMDRNKMIKAAFGTVNPGGMPDEYPDGLPPGLDKLYLTKSQLGKLEKYEPNKQKATKLLKKSGYTKTNGRWTSPRGKKLTLNMLADKATSNVVTSFKSAAADLTDFGINTEVTAVPSSKVDHDLHKGDFQITQGFPENTTPLKVYNDIIGRDNNFTVTGGNKGEPGLGYGPKVNVPGQAKINVPTTLDRQSNRVGPGNKMKKLTWSWAQAVNRDLPYLQYGNKRWQFSYMNKNYTKYPSDNNPLWDMIANTTNDGFVQAMRQDYIRPQ